MTVCKNEHSSVANTFAQSVVRVFFGQNWNTLTQAHPPGTTAVTWRQQHLRKLSQNTNKKDKIQTSSSNCLVSFNRAPSEIHIEESYNMGINEMKRWRMRENLYTLSPRNWLAFKSWKKSVNKFNLLSKYFQRGRCRRNICGLDSLSYR